MDVDDDYSNKILSYINEKLPFGGRVLVAKITNEPERLINTVKYLINTGKVDSNDIFFRSAYKNGEKLGNNNYQVLCKSRIPSSQTKLNKHGIKNDIDRESGENPGNEEP